MKHNQHWAKKFLLLTLSLCLLVLAGVVLTTNNND